MANDSVARALAIAALDGGGGTTYTAGTGIDITSNVISTEVPTITLAASQIISANPLTAQMTNDQAALIENEAVSCLYIDFTAVGLNKEYFNKTYVDNVSVILTASNGTNSDVLSYKVSTKQCAGTMGIWNNYTAGANVTISGSTISATDTTYSNATTSVAGLESAADKTKLDSLSTVSVSSTGAATDEVSYITVGGVEKKIAGGSSLDYDNITLRLNSSNKLAASCGAYYIPEEYDEHTYSNPQLMPASTEIEEIAPYAVMIPWTMPEAPEGYGETPKVKINYEGSTFQLYMNNYGSDCDYIAVIDLATGVEHSYMIRVWETELLIDPIDGTDTYLKNLVTSAISGVTVDYEFIKDAQYSTINNACIDENTWQRRMYAGNNIDITENTISCSVPVPSFDNKSIIADEDTGEYKTALGGYASSTEVAQISDTFTRWNTAYICGSTAKYAEFYAYINPLEVGTEFTVIINDIPTTFEVYSKEVATDAINCVNTGDFEVGTEYFYANQLGLIVYNQSSLVYLQRLDLQNFEQASYTVGTNVQSVTTVHPINGDYIATPPTTAGTYSLKCTVAAGGTRTYSWVADT